MNTIIFPINTLFDLGIENQFTLKHNQCIYSNNLSKNIIDSFQNEFYSYCFKVNEYFLEPTNTVEIEENIIIVSNELYNSVFKNFDSFNLKVCYDIPKVHLIKLKRIYGNFPKDDSLENELTLQLSQHIIAYVNQEIHTGEMKFIIESFELINKFESKRDERIKEKIEEYKINHTMSEIQKNFSNLKLENVSVQYDIDKKTIVGSIVDQDVEIIFVDSEEAKTWDEFEQKLLNEKIKKEKLEKEKIEKENNSNLTINKTVKSLTKEDLRAKRLALLNSTTK